MGSGPEYSRRHRRHARRAFKQMNALLRNGVYGDRPNVPNVCFLLINEKRTSRYLKGSGIEKFCDHTIVISGHDNINLATIRKKICPEAEIIRGSNISLIDWFIHSLTLFQRRSQGGSRKAQLPLWKKKVLTLLLSIARTQWGNQTCVLLRYLGMPRCWLTHNQEKQAVSSENDTKHDKST